MMHLTELVLVFKVSELLNDTSYNGINKIKRKFWKKNHLHLTVLVSVSDFGDVRYTGSCEEGENFGYRLLFSTAGSP